MVTPIIKMFIIIIINLSNSYSSFIYLATSSRSKSLRFCPRHPASAWMTPVDKIELFLETGLMAFGPFDIQLLTFDPFFFQLVNSLPGSSTTAELTFSWTRGLPWLGRFLTILTKVQSFKNSKLASG